MPTRSIALIALVLPFLSFGHEAKAQQTCANGRCYAQPAYRPQVTYQAPAVNWVYQQQAQVTPVAPPALLSSAPTIDGVKRWYRLSNYPGWEGFGALNANGWLAVPEQFRTIVAAMK